MSNTHAVSLPHNPSPDCHAKFNMAMTQFPVRYTWLHHQPTVPLSSVLHTPTQARTHSHTSPSSAVTLPEQPNSFPPTASQSSPEKENGVPCERLSLLRGGIFCSHCIILICRLHLLCAGFGNRRVHFIGLDGETSSIGHTKKKMLFFTQGVVLTWRLNVCEWAVHGFRSKLVLWISKRI